MTGRPDICLLLESTRAEGSARWALELCRFVEQRHFQLHVVCLERAGTLAIPFQHEGVPAHALDLPEDAAGMRRAWWSFAGTLSLFNLLRRLQPKIVHTTGSRTDVVGRIAARLAGVPWVLGTSRRFEPASGLLPLLARMTAYMADLQVAASPSLAREAFERGGVHPSRVRVIPPGVDFGRFAGTRPADLGPDRPLFGTLGRLVPEKGIDVLLDAAAILARRHPSLRLFIAGLGPEGLRLVRHAQRLGIDGRVSFSGEREDPEAVLAALDVFVLPSRNSGVPLALLEALAAGRPCVASAVPGVQDFITPDVHALLVPPGDPDLLAEAIGRLITDRELALRLGQSGQVLVRERFLAAPMAAAWQSLYERLLGLPRPSEAMSV